MSIVLKATTEYINAVTAADVTTTELSSYISYEDANKCSGERKFGSKDMVTASDDGAILCSAPDADTWRLVKQIHIFNRDNATATIAINLNNGTTTPTLFKATIATLESITWSAASGWKTLTASGLLKTTAHA